MKSRIAIVVILAALAALYQTSIRAYGMLGWDEAEYASLGRAVARGEGYTAGGAPHVHRPPLVPLIVAATIATTGRTDDVALRGTAIGIAIFTLLLVYVAVEKSLSPAWAAIAVAILGLMPAFWIRTPQVLSDVAFAGLFALAVWTFTRGCDDAPPLFWVSWAAFGAALLTRYTAVLFGPVVILLMLRRLRRLPLRSPHFWLAPLAALLVAGPWWTRTWIITGDPFAGLRMASAQVPAYLPGVSHPWWGYGALLLRMATFVGIATFLAGAIHAIRKRNGFVIDALAAVAVLVVYHSIYRYKEERLILAALPFIAVTAAWALREIRARAAVALVLTLFAVSAAIPARRTLSNTITLGYPSFLAAMAYLRNHAGPADVVMSASVPQTRWYADRPVVPFGDGTAQWIVTTNFERSQPAAAAALEMDVVFSDPQFRTGVRRNRSTGERPAIGAPPARPRVP